MNGGSVGLRLCTSMDTKASEGTVTSQMKTMTTVTALFILCSCIQAVELEDQHTLPKHWENDNKSRKLQSAAPVYSPVYSPAYSPAYSPYEYPPAVTPAMFPISPTALTDFTRGPSVSSTPTIGTTRPTTEAPVVTSSPAPVVTSSPAPVATSSPEPVVVSSPTPVAVSSPTPVPAPTVSMVFDLPKKEDTKTETEPEETIHIELELPELYLPDRNPPNLDLPEVEPDIQAAPPRDPFNSLADFLNSNEKVDDVKPPPPESLDFGVDISDGALLPAQPGDNGNSDTSTPDILVISSPNLDLGNILGGPNIDESVSSGGTFGVSLQQFLQLPNTGSLNSPGAGEWPPSKIEGLPLLPLERDSEEDERAPKARRKDNTETSGGRGRKRSDSSSSSTAENEQGKEKLEKGDGNNKLRVKGRKSRSGNTGSLRARSEDVQNRSDKI